MSDIVHGGKLIFWFHFESIKSQSSSLMCVFIFGVLCYKRLSNTLSIVSDAANNLQKQLFYSLVLQTLIPLVLMHFPITIFFIGPMLTLDTDFTTYVVLNTIIMYPAIDPLPNFIIIKSYRESVKACVRTVLFLGPSNSQVVHNAYSMPSVNSIVNRVVT